MRRILSVDPLTGSRTYFISHGDGSFTLENKADITPYIERNKALYNHDDGGWGEKREWRRVASIPNAIIHKLMVEHGINVMDRSHWPAVKRMLNSSEYRLWRTAPGRL